MFGLFKMAVTVLDHLILQTLQSVLDFLKREYNVSACCLKLLFLCKAFSREKKFTDWMFQFLLISVYFSFRAQKSEESVKTVHVPLFCLFDTGNFHI